MATNKRGNIIFGSKEREAKESMKALQMKMRRHNDDRQIEEYIRKHGVTKCPEGCAQGARESRSLGLDI